MKLWSILAAFLLAMQHCLFAQGLELILKKGTEALSSGVWELAEMYFKEALEHPECNGATKQETAVRLAETLIREGNTTEALDLLGQSFVADHPEAPFWKAQAIAMQGRFAEAIGILSAQLTFPTAPYRSEAGLTQASLQLAIGQSQAALDTLASLIPTAEGSNRSKIQLEQVEILIDLQRAPEARAAMPPAENLSPNAATHRAFLEAQLLLLEKSFADAEAAFQALVNQPQNQSPVRHEAAAIGLADALHAQGKSEAATLSFLNFVQDHPKSSLLETMFQRLLQWLPEKTLPTDPLLVRTAQWITDPNPSLNGIIADPDNIESAAPAALPQDTPKSDLQLLRAYSLFARAIGLHRIGTPEAITESYYLLNRLRVEFPEHSLSNRALYQLAAWRLKEGAPEKAIGILEAIRDSAPSSTLKGEALFLEARINLLQQNPKKAIALFEEAALLLDNEEARLAKKHAAVSRFRFRIDSETELIQDPNSPDPNLDTDIQLERALATTPPTAAKTALEEFLTNHPDHPRASEARLAAIHAALTGPSPDLNFAKTQLEILTPKPDATAAVPSAQLAQARMLLAERSNDTPATIAAAQFILETFPNDPIASDAALTLGRCHFQAGDYNPARLVFEKLAATDADPARGQVAWLLAARSAALGGTPQSKEQALTLFDNAIAGKGSLSSVATLEKAGHLIEMYRLSEASKFLESWIKTLPKDDPLQLPAGLLLGEALYAQGSSNPASLVEALAVYDNLLSLAKGQPSLFNRLQYLRGITLEQLPDAKDPTQKREKEAFQAFLSVLDTTTPPREWEYFERCGFRALAYLEKDETRLQTAVTIAKKIASFQGPRAAEAAARASNLQLIAPWTD